MFVCPRIVSMAPMRLGGAFGGSLARGGGGEAIAHPRLSEQVLRFRWFDLDLPAQVTNRRAEVFGLLAAIGSPRGLEEPAVGNRLIEMADKEPQKVVFLGSQVPGSAG